MENSGKLSIVGTPIGNLKDLSKRAIEAFTLCDAIYCEDTRVTSKLLNHLKISKPTFRADENTIRSVGDEIINKIFNGQHLVFVSDAGMPCISDPGYALVDAAQNSNIDVEVIPGPSAVTCAIALSGFNAHHFYFEGFLPRHAGERQSRLSSLLDIDAVIVIYESALRVIASLSALSNLKCSRKVAVVREITKVHEECIRGTVDEVLERINRKDTFKGECVLVIDSPEPEEKKQIISVDDASAMMKIADAMAKAGTPKSEASKILSKLTKYSKNDIYKLLI